MVSVFTKKRMRMCMTMFQSFISNLDSYGTYGEQTSLIGAVYKPRGQNFGQF